MSKKLRTSLIVSFATYIVGVALFFAIGLGSHSFGNSAAFGSDFLKYFTGVLWTERVRVAILFTILFVLVVIQEILLFVKHANTQFKKDAIVGIFFVLAFLILSVLIFLVIIDDNKFIFSEISSIAQKTDPISILKLGGLIITLLCFEFYIFAEIYGVGFIIFHNQEKKVVVVTAKIADKLEEKQPEKIVEEKKIETPKEVVVVVPVESKKQEAKTFQKKADIKTVAGPTEVTVAPVIIHPALAPKKESYVRISFSKRLNASDSVLKSEYKDIKKEIEAYGIKSRVSFSGDSYRLHTVKYLKITVAGKKLKLYYKLAPHKYDGTTIPHDDVSSKGIYKDTPLAFKVRSTLSVNRAKKLIKDMMTEAGYAKKETAIKETKVTK